MPTGMGTGSIAGIAGFQYIGAKDLQLPADEK